MKIDVATDKGEGASDFVVMIRLENRETVRFEVKSEDGTQAVGWAMGNLDSDFTSFSKWEKRQVDKLDVFSTEEEARRVQSVESALLGFMRDHPRDIGVAYALETLRVDDFKFLRHQFIFSAIQDLSRRGEVVNTKSIVAECDKITVGMHSGYWVPAWFVDAMGGDLDPAMCFAKILQRRTSDEK
ncbi:MAG: hypothetical protein KDE20_24870 [Caldilineaceae bacterium]|nr:hypothetical protein [Caldilineaceae bacterium]MCB9161657.1 hypothetical protein [Caldilineaceae bacterium]